MASALRYVFVAVAVICCMQAVEMARLPRDTADTPALPTNILDSLAKPEFWNSLSQNLTSVFSEDNLKQLGIKPELVKDTLNNAANEFQKNFAELTKNLQGMTDQQATNQPQKTSK